MAQTRTSPVAGPRPFTTRKPAPTVQLSTCITNSTLSLDLDSAKGSLTDQIKALSALPPMAKRPLPPRPPLFQDVFAPAAPEGYSDFPPTPGINSPPLSPYSGGASPERERESKVPLAHNSSLFLHKGFWDLLGLAQASGQSLSRIAASSPLLGGWDAGGYNAAKLFPPPTAEVKRPSPPLLSATNGVQRKRISVDMISRPMGFAHLCHASDAEQAEAILLKWQRDGIGKLPDPAWVIPIKEAARTRARAHGVAQVQANRDDFGDRVQTLRVVNPSSSLLANVAARPSTAPAAPSTPPPVLRTNTADTIVLRPAPTRPRLDPSPLSQRAIDGLPPASAETKAIKFAPSLETLERTAAASIYFEQLYHGILKLPRARDQRLNQLEAALRSLPDAERRAARAAWAVAETEYLREIRAKVSVGSFAKLKTVGAGAFGVVNLVREQGTGELFAMKQLSKDFMLRKSQEGHVRAERDFLAQASHTTRWIVRLAYSFQDADNLYLVLEWMGGGDMLNLLIERDTFPEQMARFYVAEMILAIEEVHRMGFIHRDIKPDNFLLDSSGEAIELEDCPKLTGAGHLKLSDFGLATDFHWAHDGAYYEMQRKALLRKHGIDLEDSGTVRRRDVQQNFDEDEPSKKIFTVREKNKRKLAYSVVGTNNYMAPEVLRGNGYGPSCDYWSTGIIAFEMLFGYPCFSAKTRHVTRNKILNWRQNLKFPAKPQVSWDAQDFIEKLVCEREDRLGSQTLANTARPNSHVLSQRHSGFFSAPVNGQSTHQLKTHSWFRGLDFNTIHLQTPPFVPDLCTESDTRYFEDNISPEPLAPADGANPEATKDPILRHKEHGKHIMEVRKSTAFAGYTYRRPKRLLHDPRTGILNMSDGAKDRGRSMEREPGGSGVRSMSL